MTVRRLMTGNEAVARGAWEAGVRVATAYPGTPSTEITEHLARFEEVRTEWSVNEKVALEVAIGSSFAGARSIVSMKHVGLNVAADPLFTLVYTGVNAGLVIVTADEPGMPSSQNEQDNRYYAKFAQLPMLEPADACEALEMTRAAFEISEKYDTPVLLRLTTRICHTSMPVTPGTRADVPLKKYHKNTGKYAMIPVYAKSRHVEVIERVHRLQAFTDHCEFHRVELRSPAVGVITSGISYLNVREAMPEASVLKIGMSWPTPKDLIREFSKKCEKLYIVEEGREYLEEEVRCLGIEAESKADYRSVGELPASTLRRVLSHIEPTQKAAAEDIPPRAPQLCPGCGHRGVFHILGKRRFTVLGDIGCYSLGALPPFNAMDVLICMGASIGMEHGFSMVEGVPENRVAIIGDSTFFHSGMTNLLNTYFNNGTTTAIILDNRITAMTGHQPNPGSGMHADGTRGVHIDIPAMCRALGIRNVREIDGYDLDGFENALMEEVARPEPSVLVVNSRCVFVEKPHPGPSLEVDQELCNQCRQCLRVGCPAISFDGDRVAISGELCDGCSVCVQVCPKDAINAPECES